MVIDKTKFQLAKARRCMSNADLKAAGVTTGNLNSIWNGKSVLPETAGKVARALNVDVLDIIKTESL